MSAVPGIEVTNISVLADKERDTSPQFVDLDGLQRIDFGPTATIEYEMFVMAFSERAAKAKARSFVRAKNPFEPMFVQVFANQMVDKSATRNKYSITARVGK